MFCVNTINKLDHQINYLELEHESSDTIIIMTHGYPDNAFGLTHLIEQFSSEYHIIAPFLPGSLNRLSKRKTYGFKKFGADLRMILDRVDRLKQKKIILIGHDLGCFYNIESSNLLKRDIIGIINLNGLGIKQFAGRLLTSSQLFRSSYVFFAQSKIIENVVTRFFPDLFLKNIYNMCGVSKTSKLRAHRHNIIGATYLYRSLFIECIKSCFKHRQKTFIPTLFIWGNKDHFLKIPSQSEVNRYYKKGEVRILPGGHWIHDSNLLHVSKLLNRYFAKCIKLSNERGAFV